MSRFFNQSERLALYVAADGKCQQCGKPLDHGWHADHIIPYSKNGSTDVMNGQALCIECNLRKGNRMDIEYRTWQNEMYEEFKQYRDKWYTLVATPGSGKTIAMLRCAAYSIREAKEADFLIIVAPTDALKEQWKRKARELYGLQLQAQFNGYAHSDMDGIVVTYQQLSGPVGRHSIRMLHRLHKCFVILDEPHHMADQKAWGDGAKDAFEYSTRGILGTGTPFRSDDYAIPFVTYDAASREMVTQYEYLYQDGLIDYVVRELFFRKTDADATWYSYKDEIVTASFYDKVDDRQAQERLNTAIAPDSDFVRRILKQSYEELVRIRQTRQPNAALLIIAKNTQHLDAIAQVFEQVNGIPLVTVSSREGHGDKSDIEEFSKSDAPAIGAVDMISEGVDIPRLRSLVYLTNVTSPLYFYQAIGRVVRTEKGQELENGYVYLPSDERLLALAHEIKKRRNHVLKDFDRICQRCGNNPCTCPPIIKCEPKQFSLFEPVSADPIVDGGIYSEEDYNENELETATQWVKINGFRIPVEEAAKILRKNTSWLMPHSMQNVAHPEPDLEKMRTDLANTANRHAYHLSQKLGIKPQDVHTMWVTDRGGKWQKEETVDGLKAKITWLKTELHKLRGTTYE